MARYTLVWSDIPRDQYDSLPPETQAQIDATLNRLQDDPERYGSFDKAADQWSATFGDGSGFVLYIISHAEVKVVLLRILSI